MSSISLLSQGQWWRKANREGMRTVRGSPSHICKLFFCICLRAHCIYFLSRHLLHTSKAALDRVRKKAIINKELKMNQRQSSFPAKTLQPCAHHKEQQELYGSKAMLRLPHRTAKGCFLQSCSNCWLKQWGKRTSYQLMIKDSLAEQWLQSLPDQHQ